MNNAIDLPSLEAIEAMDNQREKAVEISGNSVKCQKCGLDLPMGKLDKPHAATRIAVLEHRKISK